MKKLLFAAVVSLLLVPKVCSAYNDGDWQFWTEEGIEGPLTDRCKAKLSQEFKWGDNISEFYDSETYLGLDFKATDWLSIEPGYKHIYELKSGEWNREYRPLVNGTVKWRFEDWDFKYRIRLEYRDREISDDVWRLRNKIQVNTPWKWTSWGINPYVADEIFSEENQDRAIYRNRLYTGLVIKKLFMMERLEGDLYFLWETTDKNNSWQDVYVLGAKIKVHF